MGFWLLVAVIGGLSLVGLADLLTALWRWLVGGRDCRPVTVVRLPAHPAQVEGVLRGALCESRLRGGLLVALPGPQTEPAALAVAAAFCRRHSEVSLCRDGPLARLLTARQG